MYNNVRIGHNFLISRKLRYPRRCRISQLLPYYPPKKGQARSLVNRLRPLEPAFLWCVYYTVGVYNSAGNKMALCIGKYMDLQQITVQNLLLTQPYTQQS